MTSATVNRPRVVLSDLRVDRTSPVPLWHQLAQALESAVVGGQLQPGDFLEDETALVVRLGLSRPTISHALQALAKKGLVVRKRGFGTQVLNGHVTRNIQLSSLYDDLEDAGNDPDTRLLDVGSGPEDDQAAALLAAAQADGDLLRVRRLRKAAGVPLAILTNYIPTRFGIDAAELVGQGLYACLRRRGVTLNVAHQQVGARRLDAAESNLLDEPDIAAGLTIIRTVFDDKGQFVELGRHVYRGSQYTLGFSLVS